MSAALAEQVAKSIGRLEAVDSLATNGCFTLRENASHVVTLGVPSVGLEAQQRIIGIRIIQWPRRAFELKRVSVLSSRLGKKLDQQTRWFDAFRTLCCRLYSDESVFVTADGTTADRFVVRASELFQIDSFRLVECDDIQIDSDPTSDHEIRVSKPIVQCDEPTTPLADRMLAVLARTAYCLDARASGNTHKSVSSVLRGGFWPMQVMVPNTAPCSQQLVNEGAFSWILLPPDEVEESPQPSNVRKHIPTAPPCDNYLVHWTRRRDGPWPGETDEEYLDQLILGVETKDRSAFATLCRIVSDQRIVASSHLIRGGHEVVCFSDITLEQLAGRRVYRKHLRRWDYEPYGVAVRRDVLEKHGALPVIYGGDEDFEHLGPGDKPFFQMRSTGDGETQWTEESEWRIKGSVLLRDQPPGDAFVFVPSEAEAAALSQFCSWPVVVVPSGSD